MGAEEGGSREAPCGPQHWVISQSFANLPYLTLNGAQPRAAQGAGAARAAKSPAGQSAGRELNRSSIKDFFLGFPEVPGVGWLLDSCSRLLLFLAIFPVSREQLQHTTVFPKHASGRQPLASPEEHAASARAHLGIN